METRENVTIKIKIRKIIADYFSDNPCCNEAREGAMEDATDEIFQLIKNEKSAAVVQTQHETAHDLRQLLGMKDW